MNAQIQEIMKLLKVSEFTANEVYDDMQIDLSECTQAQFNREARNVYAALISEAQGGQHE
jgi:hypothetical protein